MQENVLSPFPANRPATLRLTRARRAELCLPPWIPAGTPSRPFPLAIGIALLLCCAFPISGFAADIESATTPPATGASNPPPPTAAAAELPSVDKLMGELLARLPSQPILLAGDLVTTSDKGPKTRLSIDIHLSYPHTAAYTVRDAFGKELEALIVSRNGKAVSLSYRQNGVEAAPPSLGNRVQDSALTWMDITLGFLWWEGGQIIGQMETRGQPCYVLDRHAPTGGSHPYASVRMWVDKRVSMLLQAEGYNMTGDCIRRLSVKSIRKINDEWMVKDLEFEDLAEGRRTILRVRSAGIDQG